MQDERGYLHTQVGKHKIRLGAKGNSADARTVEYWMVTDVFVTLRRVLGDVFESRDPWRMAQNSIIESGQLIQFFLSGWLAFQSLPADDRADALEMILGDADPHAIMFNRMESFDSRPISVACFKALAPDATYIAPYTAGSLLYVEGAIDAFMWKPRVLERMRTELAMLWRQPFLVAELTAIRCAYAFGVEYIKEKREFVNPNAEMILREYALVPDIEQRLIDQFSVNMGAYLGREPTRAEVTLCEQFFKDKKRAALPFVNNYDNPKFIDNIAPFTL